MELQTDRRTDKPKLCLAMMLRLKSIEEIKMCGKGLIEVDTLSRKAHNEI